MRGKPDQKSKMYGICIHFRFVPSCSGSDLVLRVVAAELVRLRVASFVVAERQTARPGSLTMQRGRVETETDAANALSQCRAVSSEGN